LNFFPAVGLARQAQPPQGPPAPFFGGFVPDLPDLITFGESNCPFPVSYPANETAGQGINRMNINEGRRAGASPAPTTGIREEEPKLPVVITPKQVILARFVV
jgi:hypothetical protein